MERKDFLKGIGLTSLGLAMPLPNKAVTSIKKEYPFARPTCFLTPAVPQGPLYLNTGLIRQNISETKTGVALTYNFTVVDANCTPIPNAVVDIWQCDKDGIYSGFSSQNTLGQTFLRGVQITDANGQVSFTAIYPGWYNGRLTHLHVKVFFNNDLFVTTNFFYPNEVNQAVYATSLYTKGQNPTTIAQDIELSGDTTRFNNLLMTFTGDAATAYVANYTVGINTVFTDILPANTEAKEPLVLKQNFPNPFNDITTIKFSLLQSSKVTVTLLDMAGKEVTKLIQNETMSAGEHFVDVKQTMGNVKLVAGAYLYQLTIKNEQGQFQQSKVLTIQ